MAQVKRRWLEAQGVDADEMQSLCLPRGYWPPETMLLLRLLVLQEADLPRDKGALQALSDLGLKNAFEASVERRALRALCALCRAARRGPGRHARADALALAAEDFAARPPKERFAIMTRSGEVKVLDTNLLRIERLIEQIPFAACHRNRPGAFPPRSLRSRRRAGSRRFLAWRLTPSPKTSTSS